jgi:hypothetical protein
MSARRVPDVDVVRYGRQEFLTEVWDYKTGEHVTILAPSGGGKTQLGYELLAVTATPELPAVVLVMKPRDETVSKFVKRNHYRVVRRWPPSLYDRQVRKPPGYALWPSPTWDIDRDEAAQKVIFGQCIRWCYREGKWIIFGDETYSLENELPAGGLKKEIRTVHTKGRSMDAGLWVSSQRAAYISMWSYQAHHLFLGNDTTEAAQKRMAEIGANVDKDLVRHIIANLQQWEFLYINRDHRTMCIVDKD